jgi:hypothetical protein
VLENVLTGPTPQELSQDGKRWDIQNQLVLHSAREGAACMPRIVDSGVGGKRTEDTDDPFRPDLSFILEPREPLGIFEDLDDPNDKCRRREVREEYGR